MTTNKEWKEVCRAYCNKIDAELLFVNDSDFGFEKDEHLVHMFADELYEILSRKEA